MAEIFTCVLLLLSLSGTVTEYVYVSKKMNWTDAQKYCRQTYVDLAPVSDMNDFGTLQQLARNANDQDCIWIGLQRNASNREQWLWSGGGAVSWIFWAYTEPNDHDSNEENACVTNTGCCDTKPQDVRTSFCYSGLVVVRDRKTWEEALEYCREHHDDLASVTSETEKLLIQRELNKYSTTEHVWIALRFLSGDWLWVDGQELNYTAWGQEREPSCPDVKMKCGALQVTGGSQGVWEARDCEETLHFICY